MLKSAAGSSAEHLSHEVRVSFPALIDQTRTGAQPVAAPHTGARTVSARPAGSGRCARHRAPRQADATARCAARRLPVVAPTLPGAPRSTPTAR